MLGNLTNLLFAGGSVSIVGLLLAVAFFRARASKATALASNAAKDMEALAAQYRSTLADLTKSRASELNLQRMIQASQEETDRVRRSLAEAQAEVHKLDSEARTLLEQLANLSTDEAARTAARRIQEMLG